MPAAATLEEAMNTLKTVRDYIRWGASRFNAAGLFYGHGTDNALDESAALVMHALHLDHGLPETYLDGVLTAAEREQVIKLIEARIETRKPAAYLTHEAWFAGLSFYVDERVIVPRSPIAELIADRFAPWIDPEQVGAVLDLCTGCGCIGIACAHAFPGARVDAVDISVDALAVAQRNVERHGLGQRVRLVESDLFGGVGDGCYDVIVSNPPYVGVGELQTLPQEFRHEPALALAAGADGMDIVARILVEAADHLTESGILIVEVGYSQEALVVRYPEVPFLWLDFEHGGEGVFLLERRQLLDYRHAFESGVEARAGASGAQEGVN
jgi:ribosomal protein L3 glutamine methyltransferase